MLVERYVDALHLGDHLHAALRLARLGRLGAETVDEALQMGAPRLLLLLRRDVERALQCAGVGEGVVIAGVELQLAVLEMQDELGGGVEQVAVMADDHHRAAIALQEVLQPHHAFEIEIIGRLVEQKEVRRAEQDRGEGHAHAPAAGELRTRTKLVGGREAEAGQNLRRPCRRGIGVDRIEPVIDVAQRMRVALMLGGGQQPRALRIGGEHGVEQAHLGARRLLRHRADAPGARPADLAVVGMELAEDHLEQRRFARAVAPDKAHAPPGGEARGRPVQDFAARDADDEVVDAQHGARRIAEPGGVL